MYWKVVQLVKMHKEISFDMLPPKDSHLAFLAELLQGE